MERAGFNYGQVVSHKLFPDRPSTREFYCIDKSTVEFIRFLAEQSSFPVWDKHEPEFWARKVPGRRGELLVSQTLSGWPAVRTDQSNEKTLTDLEHILMPILFPSPEMALAVAELCYPEPHPALCWNGEVPECTDLDAQGDHVLGKIGWGRCLAILDFSMERSAGLAR
jgi:hypothetical protein